MRLCGAREVRCCREEWTVSCAGAFPLALSSRLGPSFQSTVSKSSVSEVLVEEVDGDDSDTARQSVVDFLSYFFLEHSDKV